MGLAQSMSNTAAFMASGAIITAWLLWSLRLEPFVATLDPGKGAELTFSKTRAGRGVVEAAHGTSVTNQPSTSQLYTVAVFFRGLPLSLVSSFYVMHQPAVWSQRHLTLFNAMPKNGSRQKRPRLLLTPVDIAGCPWNRPPSPTRAYPQDLAFLRSPEASLAGQSRSLFRRWSPCPFRGSSTERQSQPGPEEDVG